MKKISTIVLIFIVLLFSACSNNKVKKATDNTLGTSNNNMATEAPEATSTPEATKSPQVTQTPEVSKAPSETATQKETPKPQEGAKASTNKATAITGAQAENLVREFLKKKGEYIPSIISVDNEDDKTFTVHCYDVIGKGTSEQHTATSGWYTVDKATGEIKSMF
jgi:uncharacterized lipoprotein